jgi:hypothetical protein
MTDRIDPTAWPSTRGPWPEVTDPSRLYDHGRAWCTNAAGHPGDDGYPDPDRHVPWHECRGPELSISEVRRDLDGEQVEMSAYVAAAFRYGQPRELPPQSPTRVVIETWERASDETTMRLSLSAGEALRLARVLTHLVDEITFARRAA